jgi:histidinol-phosphate aminotransferase
MSCDFGLLAAEGVRALSPYQPGKPVEELERELGLDHIVKLASNENPLRPSQAVLSACRESLSQICRYPDSNGFGLKNALANKLSVKAGQLVLGCGSNDVLDLIARVFLTPGTSAVYSQHAFIVYSISIQAVGWGHDLKAMAKAIVEDTRVVFIANPNNPTGTSFRLSEFVEFMRKVPENVLVVLDEAYYEYAADEYHPDGVALLSEYPNLIVTRTFSKAYGLAALRVGYAVAAANVADLINRVRAPFNTNSFALSAAEAVLSDQDYLDRSRQLNNDGMVQLTAGMEKLGLDYIPSSGNFLTVKFEREAIEIYQELLHKGVIVRPIGIYEMPRHLRISIGLTEENDKFLTALKSIL